MTNLALDVAERRVVLYPLHTALATASLVRRLDPISRAQPPRIEICTTARISEPRNHPHHLRNLSLFPISPPYVPQRYRTTRASAGAIRRDCLAFPADAASAVAPAVSRRRDRATKGITIAISVPNPQGLSSVTSSHVEQHATNANHSRYGTERRKAPMRQRISIQSLTLSGSCSRSASALSTQSVPGIGSLAGAWQPNPSVPPSNPR